MSSRRIVSLAVATAVLAAALPVSAQTAPPESALRASIDRALTQAAPASATSPAGSPRVKASRAPRRQSAGTYNGGGGGGGRMILALLGTALSVGATIYVVKQMQKNTKTEPTPSFR